jgi:hypothetical protein
MPTNTEHHFQFSRKHLKATWLTDIDDYHIQHRTIVINLGNEKARISAAPEKQLPPRTSTVLKNVSIRDGDSLLLVEITDKTNIGGIVLEAGWNQLGNIADFPKDVPLWKSPQYDAGTAKFDPFYVTGLSDRVEDDKVKEYQVKVNLWFSPAKTHCAIHKHHMNPEFLEVHTQIYGIGRMQKFHFNDFDTLYQDIIMSPGETHIPFASVEKEGLFFYPWHQYYADTDCIWMANEFHPVAA